jgi:phosphoglucomutase
MNYLETYKFWLKQETLDKEMRKELIKMSDDQMKDAFFQELSFGTGGLRGILGAGTNRINIYVIRKATLGFARYLKKRYKKNRVAISFDNRIFSALFAKEAAKVLASEGIEVYLFSELRPTPMLSYAVRHFKCTGGIMITASHNPKNYNGFKVYDRTGAQLNLKDANKVIKEIGKIKNPFDIKTEENSLIQIIDDSLDYDYLNLVSKIKIHDDEKVIKIVYSPLHGTGGTIIPTFLIQEGYHVVPFMPQMAPDPYFSETASSNPEDREAYTKSISFAKEIDADIVMVTDPDGDRLGIAVKHNDDFVLLNGNQTATIELYYILMEKMQLGLLPEKGFVYTTNVTTDLIMLIAQAFGMEVITTLTGFKFIGEQAEKNKKLGTYIFGAEESFGSLISDFVRDKDAVQAVYMLAEISNHLKLQNRTLIDYLDEIYQKYGYFYEFTISLNLPGLKGLDQIHKIMEHYAKNPPQIKYKKLIAYDDLRIGKTFILDESKKLDLPKSNVLKYYYEDETWITFRPSGTEPKIKIYFGTKGNSMFEAMSYVGDLSDQIKNEINAL